MRSRQAGIALVVLLVLVSCDPDPLRPSPEKTDLPPAPSGEVVATYPEEPVSLNPYAVEGDTNATRDVLRTVLPTLLTIDPDMKYQPGLAVRVPRSADISADGRSILYRLDKRAKWSDGTPVSAEDVKFTWEAIKEADLPTRGNYRLLADVQVIDPSTLRLVFGTRFPRWRDLFSSGDFILPKHRLEGKDLSKELGEGPPVSGGPYLIESWTRGLEIVLLANPRWWREGPSLERLKLQFVPDIEVALGLLESKRSDVLISTSQRGLEARADRIQGVRAESRFGSAWWELVFNCSKAPTNDVRFRQAVASGIDRSGIVEALVRSEGRPLESVVPGRKGKDSFSRYVRDPAALRERLSSMGFRRGGDGRYSTSGPPIGASTSGPNALAGFVLRAIRQNVRNAGLQLEIRSPVPEVLYGRWQGGGDFDIALLERRGSPGMTLSTTYRSNRLPPKGRNYSRISSTELDSLLDEADTSVAAENLVMDTLAELVPILPIFETKLLVAYGEQITGTEPNATVDGPLWNVHMWSRSL